MKKMLQKIALALTLMLFSGGLFAQGYVKGVITDEATNETLAGASVVLKGTTSGTSADINGGFTLEIPAGQQVIVIQFVGYEAKEMTVSARQGQTTNLGTIALTGNQIGLQEVNVFASIAIDRKTPVALSTIEPQLIEEKLGTQEFPEILKSTPGIYATKQGGGFGDSRVNLRGFESANIAVMINGVPVNDMEWGGVYWSNWAGLSDVTRSMQVQRGLGASKVAAPSLGGSINIVTRTTDAKKGGALSYGIGNDGYSKIGFSVSTGLTDKNWAFTIMGAKTSGNGYIQGTEFESYSYFVNISKKINESHQLSFTAFGAPQWHNQRNSADKLLISEWQKQPNKYLYNASYGFDMNGQQRASSYNVYNKPQISLNHFWNISHKTSLSTAIYMSIGDGYGYSGQGVNRSLWYGASNGIPSITLRAPDGTFDYGAIYAINQASLQGSELVMSKSVNQHIWYGGISTFSTKLGENIDIYGGLDVRYYKGIHTNVITDLYGGSFFLDPTARPLVTDQSFRTAKLAVGDVVYRDYDGFVFSQGVFMQAEYNKNKLAAFVSLSGSNTINWRYDRFYYNPDAARSETVSFLGYGAKGGANYNLSDKHNVFANVGILSRAPFFSGGAFLQSTTSNVTNPNAVNERAFSAEVGYGYRSNLFSANLNVYRTLWMDKTMVRAINANTPESLVVNMEGVNALHQGVELDFVSKPIEGVEIRGMISVGDWNWKDDASGYLYNLNGEPVDALGNVVVLQSPEHAKVDVMIGGIHVGNSAQTTAAIGAKYEISKGFNLGIDANYYGRNFAYFNISSVGTNLNPTTFAQPWQIPDATIFDLNASYRFKIGTFDATLVGNIQNLLDAEYITDATDGVNHDWLTSPVFYGFGRTFSASLKIKF
ncbi:MAG TPA: TonB-dependent receptor [Bacteroidales bacterium]|nr:TonB-dependent receptor [Bacteroidales bacterium]